MTLFAAPETRARRVMNEPLDVRSLSRFQGDLTPRAAPDAVDPIPPHEGDRHFLLGNGGPISHGEKTQWGIFPCPGHGLSGRLEMFQNPF
jgi:hypothetical protein